MKKFPPFKDGHIEIGAWGEKMSARFLKRNGYKILRTNVRCPCGEIDIIAKDHNDILVFIEVKTLSRLRHNNGQAIELRPEDNLTQAKLFKLRRACLFFANQNPALAERGWRIDLLALTISEKYCDVRHLKSIG
ncbi:MAG: YraN family protein [Parcubacteria group bacterium]